MDLIIDIGNTNTKTGIFGNDGSLAGDVSISKGEPSADMIISLLNDNPGIKKAILASVVNHSPEIIEVLRERTELLVMNPGLELPLINLYKTPETLGHDRIAAAVAGNNLFPGKNVLIISAGTCITYDFTDSERKYHGGSISPGMQMRFKSLHTFTGKLPLISPDESWQLTGDSTPASIKSGVMEGIAAEMEGIAGKYRLLYPDLQVILSGGDLIYFVKRLKINIFAFPNIVIHGLHKILIFNVDLSS